MRTVRAGVFAVAGLFCMSCHAESDDASAAADSAVPVASATPSWSEEERTAQRQAGEQLLSRIREAAAAGEKSFRVEPGNYRFAKPVFVLNGLKDFTIEAEGATFWIEYGKQVGVKLDNCHGVVLRGLTIDYDPLPFSQAVIREIDRETRQIVVEIEPGYPVPDDEWIQAASRMGPFKALFYNAKGDRQLDVRLDWTVGLEPLGDRRFRLGFSQGYPFKNATSETTFQVGDRYVLPYRRHQPALALNECGNVTVENVTIYTSPAMGIVEWAGPGGNRYLNCRITRRPGTNRLISTVADAFHSAQLVKGPLIEGCEFAWTGDDLIAIHGFFSVVLEQRSPTQIVLATVFATDFQPSSHLRFYDIVRGGPVGESAVRSVQPLNSAEIKAAAGAMPRSVYETHKVNVRGLVRAETSLVTLATPVDLPPFAVAASNELCSAGAIVRGNHLHDTRVRGVAIRSENALVENNRIERTGMGGITTSPDRFFLEGPHARGIVIRGNKLTDCGLTSFNQHYVHRENFAAITVTVDFGPHFCPVPLHEDIEIVGNTIIRPAGPGIVFSNVNGGLIADNTIVTPYAKLADLPPGPVLPRYDVESTDWKDPPLVAIALMASRNVTVKSNTMTDPPAGVSELVSEGPWNKPGSIAISEQPTASQAAASQPRP